MKRKGIMWLLTVMVLSLLLVACGGEKTPSTAAEKGEFTPAVVDADGKIGGLVYKEGLPIVDPGTYAFSIFTDATKTTDDFYLMPILEEQTGINVRVDHYPFAVAKEKYSLSLNSGDYADVIGGWILTQADILKFGVDMGIYIPLEDLIAEYAPNIEALLNMEGVRETMTAPDGHIYSIPYVLDAPLVDFNPYINIRWLENVGMEMPTTTEELKQVLIAFKEQDANGNGNPNDEIPFSFEPDNRKFGYYAGWWGLPMDKYGFTIIDGELIFAANSQEYKEMILYMRDLYSLGLIDPETFTTDKTQWKAKGNGDFYGVAQMYGSGDIMPFKAGETPDWRALPVLSAPGVTDPKWYKDSYGTTVLKNQVVITDRAESPEAIIRWWDNQFEFKNSIRTNGGPIGIRLFEDEENGDWYIDESNMTEEQIEEYNWFNLWPQSLPRFIPLGFKFREPEKYREKDITDELYGPYLLEDPVPPYWVPEDVSAELSDISTAITSYVDQKTAAWISGQADVEKEWDTYLKQLDRFGLEKYVRIRREVLGQ